MTLLYVDPSGSNLLMQILAPTFVAISIAAGSMKEKIVRTARHLSRLLARVK